MNYPRRVLLFICVLMPLLPLKVSAGQLFLDSRVDYKSFMPNDIVSANGSPGYEAFQITRRKLDYQGKLGELNTFRTRIDPLNNDQASSARDKTSKFIDLAYLTRKIADHVDFTMG